MATWRDIKSFARGIPGVTVVAEQGSVMQVEIGFDDGRSHRAFITERRSGVGSHWVVISVIVAESSPARLEAVARAASRYFCGGVATYTLNGFTGIVLQEGFPTTNLDPMEFVAPLSVLAATADHLEKVITGGSDVF